MLNIENSFKFAFFVVSFAEKMSEIIEKIKFFHSLRLKPTSNDETIGWTIEMDRHLISLFNLNECFVRVEKIKKKVVLIEKIEKSVVLVEKTKKNDKIPSSSRVLRLRKKKKCCYMCVRVNKINH